MTAVTTSDAAAIIDGERPWPGLLPFPEEGKAFFHGRDAEADELLRLVEREPLTVLFGQSGLGKSSLLCAGLFPRLRKAGYLPVYLRLNHDRNAPDLLAQAWQALLDASAANDVIAPAVKAGESFWEYLHRPDCVFRNPHGRAVIPVLVFDQFEECFTLGRQTPETEMRCRQFMGELAALIENRVPAALEVALAANPEKIDSLDLYRRSLKVVFSFREDYLAEFEELKTVIRPIMQNRMRLTPMTGTKALQALLLAGQEKIDADAANRIVRFVGAAVTGDLNSIAIEPALLSLVCHELNEQRISRGERHIDAALIGDDNAQQIIETFYIRCFAGLAPAVQAFVEDRLLTSAGHRDSCAYDNALATPGITEAAINQLVDRRLLRREERGGRIRLELTHDILTGVANTSRLTRRERSKFRSRSMIAAVLVIVALGGEVVAPWAFRQWSLLKAVNAQAERTDIAGEIVAYSTSPGIVSYDGASTDKMRSSPYSRILDHRLRETGKNLLESLQDVNNDVIKESASIGISQRPFLSTSMNGSIYLWNQPATRRKFAILVGIAKYPHLSDLKTPVEDIALMSKLLRDAGFKNDEVVTLIDNSQDQLDSAIDQACSTLKKPAPHGLTLAPELAPKPFFREATSFDETNVVFRKVSILIPKPKPNTLLLFFFSGLGFSKDGENYLTFKPERPITTEETLEASERVRSLTYRMSDCASALVTIVDVPLTDPFPSGR